MAYLIPDTWLLRQNIRNSLMHKVFRDFCQNEARYVSKCCKIFQLINSSQTINPIMLLINKEKASYMARVIIANLVTDFN